MGNKKLAIWVEGRYDKLFFERCITRKLTESYESFTIEEYAQKRKKEIGARRRFLDGNGYDQMIFGDIDSCRCPTQRKEILQEKKFGPVDTKTPIIVVRIEIESLFLSGLDKIALSELGLPHIGNTDGLSKEQFDERIPERFDSRIDFMQEISKVFSLEAAKYNNSSFRYFADRFLCI
jgi:hypothetical protein